MPVSMYQLKNNEKYRNMSVKELTHVVGGEITYDDFESLPGMWAKDKAKILYSEWHKNPLEFNEVESSTSANSRSTDIKTIG